MVAQDVVVVGFGAIGSFYAYALEKSGKARVTAICRSNYDVLQQHGLDIISDRLGKAQGWKPHRIVRSIEESADRNYSFIVCATKCVPELNKTTDILSPLLEKLTQSPETAIVLLQNGIGIEDDVLDWLAQRSLKNIVLSGCAWVDTTAIDGGRTITQFGNERLVLGYHRPPTSTDATPSTTFSKDIAREKLDTFSDILKASGANVEPVADMDAARWRKVLWNASFSTICTLTRANVGDVLAVEPARNALSDVMLEVLAVARASLSPESASLLPDSVAQDIIKNENPKSVFKPSMLVDLEAGRPMEIEAIVGGVLKRAKNAGVEVPKLKLVYAGLSVIQAGLLKKSRLGDHQVRDSSTS
ncbi:2-dehydropantoate 2-reductase [Panus rudis PR-1116 ss-1]|nr:2-dehydropantoate 2-reductase [Panus rudis PR-1116 ss-1]